MKFLVDKCDFLLLVRVEELLLVALSCIIFLFFPVVLVFSPIKSPLTIVRSSLVERVWFCF
jgi:hypothetical protein